MRPIRLEIRGFTAFREPQLVDFEGLDLFAITGPTGSGKSSILDALTFVLYGRAERVGDGVRQLVSQGQPRAAVVLEFEAGGERFRVARSVTADAKTKVLVERADPGTGSGWRQAGEGADRVREADATIERLVGLDYAGFTRAVLLPQGRFAEFLAGDAKTRRRILADLLDLGLFERIAAKAGELARTHGAQVTGKTEILASEFADATDEGLAAARQEHAEAETLARRTADARTAIAALVERSTALQRERDELDRLAAGSTRNAQSARSIGQAIRGLAEAIRGAEAGRLVAQESAHRDAQLASAAAAAMSDAEVAWGDAATLAGRIERARSLGAGRTALADRRREATELAAAIGPAEAGALAASRAAAEAAEREASAIAAERAATDALESARAADRVAAISAGLAIGDPCPVCGRPLEALPDRHGAPELAAATSALELARAAAAEAAAACRAAERAATEAAGRLEREQDRVTRAETMLADEARRLDELEASLVADLGTLPADPLAELERRASELRDLAPISRRAGPPRPRPTRSCGRSTACSVRHVARWRPSGPASTRSRSRTWRPGPQPLVWAWARPSPSPSAAGPGPGARPAPVRPLSRPTIRPRWRPRRARSPTVSRPWRRAARPRSPSDRRRRVGCWSRLERAVGDLVPRAADLAALAQAVETANASAIGAEAVAARRIADLELKIVRRAELEAEIEALRERGARFKQLALELRQDRIVAFLQEEALATLAAAGSVHLEELSSGRYRLEVVDDEFLVVDTWNGEESRSVKTLSGGESFLASLGLALALSEQVPSLAASARSRVTSLFLDEGFGTLDEETLQVVIGAVEVLGGDDRMVGVVTHVTELAERLPARIVIEKSPRGSTIRRV